MKASYTASFSTSARNTDKASYPETRTYLDENLRGWLTLPKQERETSLRGRRISELDLLLVQHGRFLSYKSAKAPMEKVLATWLTPQRRLFA